MILAVGIANVTIDSPETMFKSVSCGKQHYEYRPGPSYRLQFMQSLASMCPLISTRTLSGLIRVVVVVGKLFDLVGLSYCLTVIRANIEQCERSECSSRRWHDVLERCI